MIRFIADENFDGNIIKGLRDKYPQVDIITVQEVGLSGTPDPEILAWATLTDRVVLSRDKSTMKGDAEERLHQNQRVVGLLLTTDQMSHGTIIDQIDTWSRRELEEAFAYPIQYIHPY